MALTRAEIQRNYRERKKRKEGEKYLAKERARQKKNYVPVENLSRRERTKRKEAVRQRVRKHRAKRKRENEEHIYDAELSETSGYETMSSVETSGLIVKLPALSTFRKSGPRKRVHKALKKTSRALKSAKQENEELKRKLKTTQRKMQRLKKHKTPAKPTTPMSKTKKLLEMCRVRTNNTDAVKRQLLLSNIITTEVAQKKNSKNRQFKRHLYGSVVGKLLLKYRCVTEFSKQANVNRNLLSNIIRKGVEVVKGRRRVASRYKSEVLDFLQRDDNSRMQPGKKDVMKTNEGEMQTRVLTDYIDNLHEKFLSENPEIKLSLSTFRRMRPKHILTTTFLSRSTCLCTKHQNFAFKLKMFKLHGLSSTTNPDEFVKEEKVIEKEKFPEKVVYSLWKRVECTDGKKKMKIVKEEVDKDKFWNALETELKEFKDHVSRVRRQFSMSRELKEHLPDNEVFVHMDFAENYACKTADEIQSAYWNSSQVTLHPIVIYYKEDNEVKHHSLVAISNTLIHASSTVIAILDKLYTLRLLELQNVKHVHYWTDSPTSQYRNRYIFDLVLSHEERYGFTATWNYFESGHGKGPCDGVGGTVKRMADQAVNAQKADIQDADDFFAWAQTSSIRGISFFFVQKTACDAQAEVQKKCSLQPVKGTMSLHACRKSVDDLYIAKTSCYCEACLSGALCDHWTKGNITRKNMTEERDKGENNRQKEQTEDTVEQIPKRANSDEYVAHDYVAAVYSGNWYIGQVIQDDTQEKEVEISFMQRKKELYQWPSVKDVIWVTYDNVLTKLKPPTPSGKTRRMMKFDKEDLKTVEDSFDAFQSA